MYFYLCIKVYTGKDKDKGTEELGTKVVLELTGNLEEKNHHINFDNSEVCMINSFIMYKQAYQTANVVCL